MLTSKERAKLRALANNIDTLFQVGKDGVTENVAAAANDAIEARELIKLSVLETADEDVRDAANEIAEIIEAEVVCVIGRKFVLYKENKENKKISLN